jgi:DHA2 family multidrug resistance protein
MTVFLAGLLLALSAGNARWNTGGWISDYVLACFAASFAGLLVFLAAELTVEHPMIDLRLFRNFNFGFANAIIFIFGIGMFGSTFLMPLYLQTSLGYTALQTGLMFLPIGLIQGTLSPVAGILADRTTPKLPGMLGIALLGFSLYRNSMLTLQTEPAWITATLVLRGIGAGLAFTPLNTIAVSEMPRDKMAQASGMLNVIRQVGGSVGVAIMGAIEAKRVVFHTAVRGLAIEPGSPVLHSALGALQTHAMRVGSSSAEATAQARSLLFGYVGKQAFVAAVNDCFMIAGIITLMGVVPLAMLRRRERARVDESLEAPAPVAPIESLAAAEEPLAAARPMIPPVPLPEPSRAKSAIAAK